MSEFAERPHRMERSDVIANRVRVLDAARVVFAERGLDAEVKEIAERADVGVGTLYRHFGSRDGLLAALLRQADEDILRRLEAAENESPAAAVRAMIHAGAEACERFGALTEALFSGHLGHLKDSDPERVLVEPFARVLRRGSEEGVFRADLDIPLAIAMLKSVFTSGAVGQSPERSFSETADAIADLFLRAISAGSFP